MCTNLVIASNALISLELGDVCMKRIFAAIVLIVGMATASADEPNSQFFVVIMSLDGLSSGSVATRENQGTSLACMKRLEDFLKNINPDGWWAPNDVKYAVVKGDYLYVASCD